MKANDIEPGGFFVDKQERYVREITGPMESGNLRWRSFFLSDGKYFTDGVCSRQGLAQWAGRIATPDEVSRLHIREAEAEQESRAADLVLTLLSAVPTEVLHAELRRRGQVEDQTAR